MAPASGFKAADVLHDPRVSSDVMCAGGAHGRFGS
jgi:hypothetical protein